MIAVSNTSPLMALSKIGYVVYLHELFERVFISESVELEISKKDNEVWHATKEMIEKGFIEVKAVKTYKEAGPFTNLFLTRKALPKEERK